MDNYNLFRKTFIGGFNKNDVINYIENMKNEFFDYRTQVESTIKELNKKIKELESTGRIRDDRDDSYLLNDEVGASMKKDDSDVVGDMVAVNDINDATQKLKVVADSLCDSLSNFIKNISENSISVVIESPKDKVMPKIEEKETPLPEIKSILDAKDIAELNDLLNSTKYTEDFSESENDFSIGSILNTLPGFIQNVPKVNDTVIKEKNNPSSSFIDDFISDIISQ